MADINVSKSVHRGSNMLNIALKDRAELYQRYMGFVENGGLFIPTDKRYRLGDDIFILLTLPADEMEKIPVAARVIWIAPKKGQSNRAHGIGVQFRDNGIARDKIEVQLVGMLASDKPTYTM